MNKWCVRPPGVSQSDTIAQSGAMNAMSKFKLAAANAQAHTGKDAVRSGDRFDHDEMTSKSENENCF